VLQARLLRAGAELLRPVRLRRRQAQVRRLVRPYARPQVLQARLLRASPELLRARRVLPRAELRLRSPV
jgi:hypothetical protein